MLRVSKHFAGAPSAHRPPNSYCHAAAPTKDAVWLVHVSYLQLTTSCGEFDCAVDAICVKSGSLWRLVQRQQVRTSHACSASNLQLRRIGSNACEAPDLAGQPTGSCRIQRVRSKGRAGRRVGGKGVEGVRPARDPHIWRSGNLGWTIKCPSSHRSCIYPTCSTGHLLPLSFRFSPCAFPLSVEYLLP